MTTFDTAVPSVDDARSTARRFALPVFAGVLFVSALLLFAVQPMFTKMVLPKLGGSPSVWSTAMVTFQALLFGGYLYAHLLVRSLAPGRAAMVHVLLLACVALVLPLSIASGFERPPESGVTAWLVALFMLSIGLPFVALAATAPLLQNWFIATGHPQAKNPYVLYAASNLGSFAALLAYPFLVEPFFALRTQSAMWAYGFAVLASGICIAGAMVSGQAGAKRAEPVEAAPTAGRRLAWMGLTAIPAGLCIAVTAYITTDLAAAPFLWVVPLALYLLTFVGVFRERPWIPHAWVLKLLPYAIAPVAISVLGGTKAHWLAVVALNLTAFVLVALACHGEAYRQRPEPARLTEFYLWTSFGGVVGGVFAGLIAPHVFNNTYEYPILIAAALLVLPGAYDRGVRNFIRQSGPWLALAAILVATRIAFDVRLPIAAELPMQFVLIMLAVLMLLQAAHPARVFGLAVLAMTLSATWQPGVRPLETVRSFFGVHQVVETSDRAYRILFHGTTIHGAERIRDDDGRLVEGKPEPVTYYYRGGPISDAIDSVRKFRGGIERAALVGLGTGTLACHRTDGENWTFFEIDPEVVRLARDPKNFRFLSECGDPDIVVGDARLTLPASPQRFNLIVLDAFSSDAIPVHLLTREALAGFASRLEPGGVIAIHVSNRHMELASVVATVAAEEGFIAFRKEGRDANNFLNDYRANADVVVLARSKDDLGDLPQRVGWQAIAPRPDVPAWTDDYSDVLSSILRKKLRW